MSPSPIGQRIVVRGNTGSGKSTLGSQLAQRLDLPFVEVDALFWEPQWTQPEPSVFRERLTEAVAGDSWVVAGNYSNVASEVVWPRAETIVYLDYALPLLLRRLFVRSWRRSRRHELLWGTNRERFWHHLYSRDSLLLYAITAQRRKRRSFESQMRDPRWSHLSFVRHRSPAQTERWLATIERARAPG